MKRQIFYCIFVLSFLISTALSAKADEWRFPLGLAYATALNEVSDLRYDNMKAQGFDVNDRFNWPLGFTFQPYYEFDNGIGIGTGFGPAIFSYSGKYSFTNVPVGMDLRYTFFPSSKASPYIRNTSPYVRVGARYNIAAGDYVKGSSPGIFGAVGIEFSRMRTLSLGLELSYDASEIKLEKYNRHYLDPDGNFWDYNVGEVKLKPYGIMISFFGIF